MIGTVEVEPERAAADRRRGDRQARLPVTADHSERTVVLVSRQALSRKPWVKTTLAPGSKVVMDYYERAGLVP